LKGIERKKYIKKEAQQPFKKSMNNMIVRLAIKLQNARRST